MRLIPLIITILLPGLVGCGKETPPPGVDPVYESALGDWRQNRVDRLLSETGWVNLAGLFWLQEGTSTFGSDPGNDVVFPQTAPANMGTLIRADSTISFESAPGVNILFDEKPVTSLVLKDDQNPEDDAPTILSWGPLRWWVIQRGDRLGIRLRNLEHPDLQTFAGIDHFPTDQKWTVTAKMEAHAEPIQIAVPNILGTIEYSPSPGTLVFEVDGETYRLDPTGNPGGRLFVIFADQNTGRETYGGGRFLYADPPDSTGHTVLDFNRSYNPPCAFTPYSTCPQPPAQNRLSVPVNAGEKVYRKPGEAIR